MITFGTTLLEASGTIPGTDKYCTIRTYIFAKRFYKKKVKETYTLFAFFNRHPPGGGWSIYYMQVYYKTI